MKWQFCIVIYVTFLSCSYGQWYNMKMPACPNITEGLNISMTDNGTMSEYIQSLLCWTTNITNWNLPPGLQDSGIVSCFTDSYSELIGTISQSMTNISADQSLQVYFQFLNTICTQKTNFSRCVVDRTENGTNIIDVMVLKFINVSKLEQVLDTLCNISQSIENPMECFQVLGMQASYCSSLYYGNLTTGFLTGMTSNNYTTVTELMDMYQNFICPGLQSTVDCTSIAASLCKPDISSHVKEITSLITDECSLLASNTSRAADVNPIASVFVQCGMPLYVSFASIFMANGTGDISMLCSHLEWYMDCLDKRLRTSNNFVDKLILQFLDKSKIGNFKNITVGVCNELQDTANSTSCLRTLVGAAPLCTQVYLRHIVSSIGIVVDGASYGDGFSTNIQDLTSIIGLLGMNDIETSKDNVCLLLPYITDCISIHVSTCSPSAGSLIRNTPDRILTEECKNPNENTTARYFVQSDPVGSVLLQCGLPVGIQMFSDAAGFSGNLIDTIYTSFNTVCSLGEWYMSCVNSRLSESINNLDKFFQEIIDFSKFGANRIVEIGCNTLNVDRETFGCLINAVVQDMSFFQCIANINLTMWNDFYHTQLTGSYIRSTYCPSISSLILCAKEPFSACVSNLDTLLHEISSMLFEECRFTWLNDTFATPSIGTNVTEIVMTQSSQTGNENGFTPTDDITAETSSLFQDSTSPEEVSSTNLESTTTDTRLPFPSTTTAPFSTDFPGNEPTQNIVEQSSMFSSIQHTTEQTATTSSFVVSSTEDLTTSPETTSFSTRGISTSSEAETSSQGTSTSTETMSSINDITTSPETMASSTMGTPTSTENKTSSEREITTIPTSSMTETSPMDTPISQSSETSTNRQTLVYSETTTSLSEIKTSSPGINDTALVGANVVSPDYNNSGFLLELEFINMILNFCVIVLISYIF